jgi:hypothetical protein
MIEELAATRRLLVASDFDGTLAEIVEDPDLATPLARSKAPSEPWPRQRERPWPSLAVDAAASLWNDSMTCRSS